MKIILKKNITTPNQRLNAGDEIIIACDENNIPLDHFWRNRLKDNTIDNLFEIVDESKLKKTKNK